MNELRKDLPPLPPRLRALPIDSRGFPVPFFVAWVDGKPDHRCVDPPKIARCVNERRCWLCGEPLGRFLSFTIGPMCGVNRINSEPPQHRECAEYAVRACPFLSRPHAHRRDAGLPDDVRDPAGEFLKRNPGVVGVWTTTSYKPRRADGGSGVLFALGEPEHVSWWAEGRPATLGEVRASVAGGLPSLIAMCDIDPDPAGARAELARSDVSAAARGVPALRSGHQGGQGMNVNERLAELPEISTDRVLELKREAKETARCTGAKQTAVLAQLAQREGFPSWERLMAKAGGRAAVDEVRRDVQPTEARVRRAERRAEHLRRGGQ